MKLLIKKCNDMTYQLSCTIYYLYKAGTKKNEIENKKDHITHSTTINLYCPDHHLYGKCLVALVG